MRFMRYFKAAFFARPWGMWIPPNWVLIAAFGMLGVAFESPGLWLVGAGLELAYLLFLSTSGRFMRWVDATATFAARKTTQQQIADQLGRLDASDQTRYRQLEGRCKTILTEHHDAVNRSDMQLQADGLSKLLFVYLRLLLTRTGVLRVLQGATAKSIDLRVTEVQGQLKAASTPELQQSLTDQLGILAERKKRHSEARDKLQFIEAELSRIQEQVELIREAMVMTTDPGSLSRQIDTVGQTLGATTQWIKQQQELMGQSEDLLSDAPPPVLELPAQVQKA